MFIFKERKTGTSAKTGREYDFMVISDGFDSVNVTVDGDVDTSALSKGEEIQLMGRPVIRKNREGGSYLTYEITDIKAA